VSSGEAVAVAFRVVRSLEEVQAVITALVASGDPQGVPELERSPRARTCVGALIRNAGGRVFVQRRSPTRRVLPGTWDIVGGHVESGETLEEALAREIQEETGWTLRRIATEVADWEWMHDGITHHERDFIVDVEGDLEAPQLEQGKHDAYAWIGPQELPLLMEGRDDEDNRLRDLVARVLDMIRFR
jgi:8-oxo-dGTP pyrophosphatase MutT (NUDIX family)